MLDRQQPSEVLREGEKPSGAPNLLSRSLAAEAGKARSLATPDLALADRGTWERFWSSLVDEYEHVCHDFAEAA